MFAHWNATTWALVATAAFTGIVALGVAFAWVQLLDTRRTRDAEIVLQLMEQWDSPRMIEARRLVASYAGPDSVKRMADDYRKSRASQIGAYFLFTYHLNFWEQVGQAFGKNRRALKIIWVMFGDNFTHAWITWDAVIKEAYPSASSVGSAFGQAVRKLEGKNRARVHRHEVWLFLFTPYYDVRPEERSARRRSWVVG